VDVTGKVFGAVAQDLMHGFVEPCTLGNVEERHLVCEVCPSAFGSRECSEKLEPRGYTKKCRTHGDHSGWQEIWCAPRPPQEKKDETIELVIGVVAALAAGGVLMWVLSGRGKT
jgi:hypothetical protein